MHMHQCDDHRITQIKTLLWTVFVIVTDHSSVFVSLYKKRGRVTRALAMDYWNIRAEHHLVAAVTN